MTGSSSIALLAVLAVTLTAAMTVDAAVPKKVRHPTTVAAPPPVNAATTSAPTTSSPTGSSCGGRQTSCVDDTTIKVCADLGAGLVPVQNVICSGATPLCYDGRCVDAVPTTPAPPPTAPAAEDVCHGRLSVCADCYSRTLCARLGSSLQPVSNVTCSADAPYCVDGACVPDLPADSECEAKPAPVSPFKCYGSGYFPDPADCTRYHFCVGDRAFDYTCDSNRVYDQSRAMCVPRSQAQCFRFNCKYLAGSYLLYGPDPTIYALCLSEDSRDALVSQCPPGHRLQASADNPQSVECAPYCARPGRIADPEDPVGYFECLESDGGLPITGPLHAQCPEGSAFDAASERCRPAAVSPSASSDCNATSVSTASTGNATKAPPALLTALPTAILPTTVTLL